MHPPCLFGLCGEMLFARHSTVGSSRHLAGFIFLLILSMLPMPANTASLPVLDNGLARTPPMGWNSWNKFGCHVSERLIKEMADAMVTTGMQRAGYRYVNIDDCWQVGRDGNGTIIADPNNFPNGIKALADYVHAKGLKLGIYTDVGSKTCEGRPGSLNYEQKDADTYAAWGIDYVKVDWCHSEGLNAPTQYGKMRDALAKAGRPIVFSICNWGKESPWAWGPRTGNLWRTTGDIEDKWKSVLSILDSSSQHAAAAGPGGWNDPDMLEVGNGGMTETEYRAHFSLWSIMAAPLIAGNDLRSMTPAIREILTNREVIAVDQDAAGIQGTKVYDDGEGLQVWSKPLLRRGARAVALFNRRGMAAKITVRWADLGLAEGRARVRDLWAHADRGVLEDSFTADVPSHGVVMVKIEGAQSPASSGK